MITTYAELQTSVASWLNRSDLTAIIPELIQLAEARLKRDRRVTDATCRGTFTITQDGEALPDDYYMLEAWYHDGPVYFGRIHTTSLDNLGEIKGNTNGATGVPGYAAITDGRVYFAPPPDGTYETKMSYRRMLTALSDVSTTNWLLDDHPDVYLYATLSEAAPYLDDDERLMTWEAKLEQRLDGMEKQDWNARFSGSMRRRPSRPIG